MAKDELYDVLGTDEGLDRAFAKLDEIKDAIPVWWTSGAQIGATAVRRRGVLFDHLQTVV